MKRLILAVLMLLFVVMPVFGQDVEPTQEIAPAAPELVVDAEDGVSVSLVQVIIGLLTAFAAGGIVGIAGLAVFVDRIRKDTSTVTALERLADSFPPSTKDLLENAFRVLEKTSNLAVEVFDDVPIVEKVEAPTP